MSIFSPPLPLNQQAFGTVPNLSGALVDWLQPMTFVPVLKTIDAYQVIETGTAFTFQGVIQPLDKRLLQIKDIGERAWTTWIVHTLVAIPLTPDDVILYLGKQYRVMAATDCSIYGYYRYELITDYTGAGPTIV